MVTQRAASTELPETLQAIIRVPSRMRRGFTIPGQGTSDLPHTTLRCPSNRLMQGAKRSSYVDMSKLCNAAADDSKGNPIEAYFIR
jgi:hypothetical protein